MDCQFDRIEDHLGDTPLGLSVREILAEVGVRRPALTVGVPGQFTEASTLCTNIHVSLLPHCGPACLTIPHHGELHPFKLKTKTNFFLP